MENKYKVLVVDDDKATLEALSDELDAEGFDVETIDSGFKALEKIKSGYKPDVILMDVRMPVMNGLETFKAMKKIDPDVTVIMMTAYSVEDILEEAIHEGAFACLRKPLDMDKVIQLIHESKEGVFVLVIDDDPNILESIKSEVEGEHINVSTASTPDDALKIIREKPQDVLLIDVKMPVLNGLEIYLKIKEITPNATAIMITGHRQEVQELVDEAMSKNAYTCLYKPFEANKITELIKEVMEKKRKGERLKAAS